MLVEEVDTNFLEFVNLVPSRGLPKSEELRKVMYINGTKANNHPNSSMLVKILMVP